MSCWPSGPLNLHLWVEGDTRTSEAFTHVDTSGEEIHIPASSITDWRCERCPTVYAIPTGEDPDTFMWSPGSQVVKSAPRGQIALF